MFIVAMFLISGGYTLLYWGLVNAKYWEPAKSPLIGADGKTYTYPSSSLSHGTSAVDMSLLTGVKTTLPDNTQSLYPDTVFVNHHPVPFPYYPTTSTGTARPIDAPTTPTTPTTPKAPGGNPNPIVSV